MGLDDLKSGWQQAGKDTKSNADLQKMTKVSNHPKLRRIRAKLLVESVLLIAFLLSYQNAFDGFEKPLWANVALSVFGLLLILNDVAGYLLVMKRVKGGSIVDSLKKLVLTLKKLSIFSVASSFLFGLSVILFFSAELVFDSTKYLILAGMVVSLFTFSYWSYRNWKSRIVHFSDLLGELNAT